MLAGPDGNTCSSGDTAMLGNIDSEIAILDSNGTSVLAASNSFEYCGSAEAIGYTEDTAHAMSEIESGRWPLAFLMNPTPVEEMLAVADSGEKTPPKATYFYPKLATGLVINSFDE